MTTLPLESRRALAMFSVTSIRSESRAATRMQDEDRVSDMASLLILHPVPDLFVDLSKSQDVPLVIFYGERIAFLSFIFPLLSTKLSCEKMRLP
jgi:hypothetical protein